MAIAADPSAFIHPYDEFTDIWVMILAVGVFECLGFVLSGLCFMYVDCSKASLLMTSITVFTAIFGYIFLGETLTEIETLDGILVMIALLFIYHEPLLPLFAAFIRSEKRSYVSFDHSGFEMLPMDIDDKIVTSLNGVNKNQIYQATYLFEDHGEKLEF